MPLSRGGGRGAGFSFPHSTPAFLTSILFPHQVSSPLVLTASLCHISEDPFPVSQSSQRTVRMCSLHPPPLYLLALLFGLFFFSPNKPLLSSRHTLCLLCLRSIEDKARQTCLQLVLISNRQADLGQERLRY